jgi:hypothetical protein
MARIEKLIGTSSSSTGLAESKLPSASPSMSSPRMAPVAVVMMSVRPRLLSEPSMSIWSSLDVSASNAQRLI